MITVLSKSTDSRDSMALEWVDCLLCGGYDTRLLHLINYRGVHFSIMKCQSCGMVYLTPRVVYGETIYPNPKMGDGGVTMGLRLDAGIKQRIGFGGKYMEFYDGLGVNSPRVLDFVCRDGSFLDTLRQRYGWRELYGLDNRSSLVERALEKGYNVYNKTIENAQFPDKHFDLVVMRHTLEHLYEPKIALGEIKRILKDDGYLRVEVPNFGSLSRIVSGGMWTGYYVPWHLYYFTIDTLTKLLSKSGFYVKGIDTLPYPHYLLSPIRYLRGLLKERGTRKAVGKRLDDSIAVGAVLYLPSLISTMIRKGDEIVAICQKKP